MQQDRGDYLINTYIFEDAYLGAVFTQKWSEFYFKT